MHQSKTHNSTQLKRRERLTSRRFLACGNAAKQKTTPTADAWKTSNIVVLES